MSALKKVLLFGVVAAACIELIILFDSHIFRLSTTPAAVSTLTTQFPNKSSNLVKSSVTIQSSTIHDEEIVLATSTLIKSTLPILPLGITSTTTMPQVAATQTTSSAPFPLLIPAPPISAPTTDEYLNYNFGFSVGQFMDWISEAELNKQLDDIVRLHIGWIRADISWNSIQSQNSFRFDWGPTDRLVKAANVRHLRILGVLAYTPPWARSSDCTYSATCPPADSAQFAAFAAAAVKRYAPLGVHQWEIWNEPNLKGFWKPEADPVVYTELLKATYNAIKVVDFNATVVTGGTGPAATRNGDIAPIEFLKGIYQSGGRDYFDAVGHHPYSYPALPSSVQNWSGWSQMGDTQVSLRSVMVDNGDSNKKIWMTETGAPTGGPGSVATVDNLNFKNHPDHDTEELQAKVVNDTFGAYLKYSWAGPMFWYTYKDLGTSPSTNENFFGIIRYDGSHKPAYDAMKNFLAP